MIIESLGALASIKEIVSYALKGIGDKKHKKLSTKLLMQALILELESNLLVLEKVDLSQEQNDENYKLYVQGFKCLRLDVLSAIYVTETIQKTEIVDALDSIEITIESESDKQDKDKKNGDGKAIGSAVILRTLYEKIFKGMVLVNLIESTETTALAKQITESIRIRVRLKNIQLIIEQILPKLRSPQ